MHLVELLLPLRDPEGKRFGAGEYERVARELTERFGGVTAHARAPAEGLWKEEGGGTAHDDIVVYEVMVQALDPEWWARYRKDLEGRFRQDELVIRTHRVRRL